MNRHDLLQAMAPAAAVRDPEPKTDIQLQFAMMTIQIEMQNKLREGELKAPIREVSGWQR